MSCAATCRRVVHLGLQPATLWLVARQLLCNTMVDRSRKQESPAAGLYSSHLGMAVAAGKHQRRVARSILQPDLRRRAGCQQRRHHDAVASLQKDQSAMRLWSIDVQLTEGA